MRSLFLLQIFHFALRFSQGNTKENVMADLLRIRARNGAGITWEWVDGAMVGSILIDQPPSMTINDGDVWQVELIGKEVKNRRTTATVRLVSKVQELKAWQHITELPNHWVDPVTLQCILTWMHEGTDIILVGPKGTGKTTLPFVLAQTLGWQEPCKVDVYTIKRTTDLFGSDAAVEGSTLFRRSGLLDYIERAHIALSEGVETHFLVILDEINRVHAKANESMHGLFDDTRQVSVMTTGGSKTIKVPPNVHFIGTMNAGAEYLGTHQLDEALKDRFAAIKLSPMPEDYEVRRLVSETDILESQATAIVQVARALRDAADQGQITFSPSYRACRNAARLLKYSRGNGDLNLRMVIIKSFLGWHEGSLNQKGEPIDPASEVGKAYAALRMKGVAAQQGNARDLIA